MNTDPIEFQSPGTVPAAISADVPIVALVRALNAGGMTLSNHGEGRLLIHRLPTAQILSIFSPLRRRGPAPGCYDADATLRDEIAARRAEDRRDEQTELRQARGEEA